MNRAKGNKTEQRKMHHPALHVHQLTVNYEKTPVLWDVSLEVEPGQVVGIIGPNGAGKSTFLKAMLGMLKPMSGKVEFFGHSLKRVRKRIAYVPQRESVDWEFPITVLELVLMGRYGRLGLFRWPRQADREAARRYLEMVGMEQFLHRQINQLSGGQQQRVFLARALLQEADLYFMDEPFVGIDAATEKVIVDLLHKLKEEGKTVFVVHHDLHKVEAYFDSLIMLNMRLIACGPTKKIFNERNLERAYGANNALFSEAVKRSQTKISGM
jgi:manganese/zinc/iron transport system ATP- binding protein